MSFGLSRDHRKLVSSAIALLLAITAVLLTQGSATAATGTASNPTITTLFDGAAVPNSLDASTTNGVVAVNDKVGFKWSITATDLQDGILSQTIPACWSWDTGTLGSLDTSNSLYSSSYVITDNPDGSHTLTATVSTTQPGSLGIEFQTLAATVGSKCANNSTYTPTLEVTDGNGTTTQSAAPITVKSETRSDLQKVAGTKGTADYDFGSGPEPAHYVNYTISIHKPAAGLPSIGAGATTLALPLSITDTYTTSAAGTTTDIEVVGTSLPAGDTANLSGTDLTISGPTDLDLAAGTYSVVVRIWVPTSEMPVAGDPPLTIQNTVAPVGDWGIDDNDTDTSNNMATGSYVQPSGNDGPIGFGKDIFVAKDSSNPTFGIDASHSPDYSFVTNGAVSAGSVVMSKIYFHGPTDLSGVSQGATNLIAYDFWNPAKQQLISNQGYYVGNDLDSPLPASDYTVEYTNGTNTINPESTNTWYPTVLAAGGPSMVSGVRFIYTGQPVWAPGTTGGAMWFVVSIPFNILAPSGDVSVDTAVFTSDEAAPQGGASVTIKPYLLGLSKTANKPSYISGDTILYTINPTLEPAPGDPGPVTANPFTVVDTMPPSIISVDLSSLDPSWTATQTTDGSGNLVVTFKHVGPVSSDQPIAPITYSAVTSIVAPPGNQLTNTVTLSANGAAGPTASSTVTVGQANVVTKQKVSTVGPDIQVGDPTVSWTSTWGNYQSGNQGASTFVDVLPYNGDGRGTSYSGTAQLATATLGGAAATTGTLYYTTDAPGTINPAPAASTNWIDASGVNLATINGITALKVELTDFASGDPGVGSLSVSMAVAGHKIGDVYANTVTGKTASFTFGSGTPADVVVVGGSLAGVVWNDADGNGLQGAGEAGIGAVTVTLFDASNTAVGTTTTAADGTYKFGELHSGGYYVTVDQTSLIAAVGGGVIQTYDNTPPLDDNSGTINLAKAENVKDVDFGYEPVVTKLNVVKTTNGLDVATAADAPTVVTGSTVTWSYLVTNKGNTALSGVTLDDLGTNGVVTVTPPAGFTGTLAVDESVTFTASAPATAGLYHNTATATGDPVLAGAPIAGASEASGSDESWYVGAKPGIKVVKTINGDDAATKPGVEVPDNSTMIVNFEVTNTGDTDLSQVVIADDVIASAAITCPQVGLPAGESMTCTATYPAPAAGVQHTNTATVTGTPELLPNDDQLVDVKASDDANAYVAGAPMVTIVKSINGLDANAAPGAAVLAGSTMNVTMEITNSGNVILDPVVVTDDTIATADISCPATSLAPGKSMTCTASAPAPAVGVQHTNIARVVATPGPSLDNPTPGNINSSDAAYAYVKTAPSVTIVKSINGADANAIPGVAVPAGSTMNVSMLVTNTGNVTLDPVVVTDDTIGTVSCPATSLTAGASMTCTATAPAPAMGVQHTNTATVVGTPVPTPGISTPGKVNSSDQAHAYVASKPAVTIVKSINGSDANMAPGELVQSGSTMTVTMLVTNTGNVKLDAVVVSDDKIATSAISCPTTSLVPGASMTCTASAPAPDPGKQHTNVATVFGTPVATPGDPNPGQVTGNDQANAHVASKPAVTIVKSINGSDANDAPGVLVQAGSTMTVTMLVTNTGNVKLDPVVVSDDKIATSAISCPTTSLAAGATMTCTASTPGPAAGGQHVNTATVVGTPAPAPDDATPAKVTASDKANAYAAAAPVDPTDPTDPTDPVDPTDPPEPKAPSIVVVKSINGVNANHAPGVKLDPGEAAVVRFKVTNTGNVALNPITVRDDTIAAQSISCPQTGLAAGASMTCRASLPALGVGATHKNTATVTGLVAPAAGQKTGRDRSALDGSALDGSAQDGSARKVADSDVAHAYTASTQVLPDYEEYPDKPDLPGWLPHTGASAQTLWMGVVGLLVLVAGLVLLTRPRRTASRG